MTSFVELGNKLTSLLKQVDDEMDSEFLKVDEMAKEIEKLKKANSELHKTISQYAFELSQYEARDIK